MDVFVALYEFVVEYVKFSFALITESLVYLEDEYWMEVSISIASRVFRIPTSGRC